LTGARLKLLFAGGRAPGEYTAEWDGTNDANQLVAAGVYIFRLQAGGLFTPPKCFSFVRALISLLDRFAWNCYIAA
jgi:hypothetical protein